MMSGSATVAGDRVDNKIDGGEIYINADGKKVRRVRKPKATASVDWSSNSSGPSGGGLFGLAGSILKERSASAPEARAAAPSSEDEAKDGGAAGDDSDNHKPPSSSSNGLAQMLDQATPAKKKIGAASVAGHHAEGEIYINKDGKKVRRVRRNPSLGGLLNSNTAASGGGAKGSATVAGDSSSGGEGEIYIRADGKKVRRVRRSASKASVVAGPADNNNKSSLGGFLGKDAAAKPKVTGAATVSGDRRLDGEIIIRADGKKVIRRPKSRTNSSGSLSTGDSSGGEIYRRADGKLVRRVKRSASSASAVSSNNSNGAVLLLLRR